MAKQKMGELLIRAGLIRESDLRVALAQQKTHGGRLGEHLVRMHLVNEGQIAHALATQLGLVYNDLTTPPIPAVVNLLPEKVSARLQALPTHFDPRTNILSLAVADPLDDKILKEVARITGKVVLAQVTPANILRRGIEHAYFGVEVNDEGTNEFQLVDIHGRGKKVYVGDDHELPELGTAEMMPLEASDLESLPEADHGREHSAISSEHDAVPPDEAANTPYRISPLPSGAPPSQLRSSPGAAPGPMRISPRVAPASAPPVNNESGEEALRTVMALADLLIERGYFTRAELMRTLRSK